MKGVEYMHVYIISRLSKYGNTKYLGRSIKQRDWPGGLYGMYTVNYLSKHCLSIHFR